MLEGGHGEVFMQAFSAPSPASDGAFRPLTPDGPLRSLAPAAALAALGSLPAIGSGVHHLALLDPGRDLREALPRAADAPLLPPALAALPPRPIYGRAPDALTLAARAAS